jgi:hypothetical protein
MLTSSTRDDILVSIAESAGVEYPLTVLLRILYILLQSHATIGAALSEYL